MTLLQLVSHKNKYYVWAFYFNVTKTSIKINGMMMWWSPLVIMINEILRYGLNLWTRCQNSLGPLLCEQRPKVMGTNILNLCGRWSLIVNWPEFSSLFNGSSTFELSPFLSRPKLFLYAPLSSRNASLYHLAHL